MLDSYEMILLNKILRYHLLSEYLQWNYASFNVTLIHLMLDHGIFRDIFGSQQLRAKILSNSWQEAKPVQRAMTSSYGLRKKTFNYFIVRFTQCISFFQYVCFPLPVMTHRDTSRGRHSRRLSCLLGLFMFARIACLLQPWIKTRHLDYSIWATPK